MRVSLALPLLALAAAAAAAAPAAGAPEPRAEPAAAALPRRTAGPALAQRHGDEQQAPHAAGHADMAPRATPRPLMARELGRRQQIASEAATTVSQIFYQNLTSSGILTATPYTTVVYEFPGALYPVPTDTRGISALRSVLGDAAALSTYDGYLGTAYSVFNANQNAQYGSYALGRIRTSIAAQALEKSLASVFAISDASSFSQEYFELFTQADPGWTSRYSLGVAMPTFLARPTGSVAPGAASTAAPDTQHSGTSGGAIAGAVVGVLLGVAALAALVFFLRRRRRRDGAASRMFISRPHLMEGGMAERLHSSDGRSEQVPLQDGLRRPSLVSHASTVFAAPFAKHLSGAEKSESASMLPGSPPPGTPTASTFLQPSHPLAAAAFRSASPGGSSTFSVPHDSPWRSSNVSSQPEVRSTTSSLLPASRTAPLPAGMTWEAVPAHQVSDVVPLMVMDGSSATLRSPTSGSHPLMSAMRSAPQSPASAATPAGSPPPPPPKHE